MGRRGAWALAAILLLAAGPAWLGVRWYQGHDLLLSQAPERRASRLALPARESGVALPLDVPFALIHDTAGRLLPEAFSDAGEAEGTRYRYTVRRTRGITLSRAEDGDLRVTTSLVVNGDAGLSGGLAELLALGAKNFDAAADVQADLALSLDENWCPTVGLDVAYQWTKSPRLEVIGGVWVNVEERVRGRVDAALRDLPRLLREAMPCDAIRRQMQEAWRNYDIPVQLPAAPPLHVLVHPLSLGLSGLAVEQDRLRLGLALQARTAVSATGGGMPPAGPLPPLRRVPDRNGRLQLSIPIRAGYDMIRDWLMEQFGRRDIPFEVAGQQGRLRIQEIFLYPSAPAVVAAIRFTVDLPGTLFDTSGRVTLSARPVVERGGTRIRLAEIRFARDVDSLLWSAATLAFEAQIRARIAEIAVYDLRQGMADALKALQRTLSDPARTGGVRLTLSRPSLRLEQVVPEADALTVLGTAEATVSAELRTLPGG
ncbi:DUF4403 family protein [Roseomonas sp. E05]|uniref:DUF4403 family protein n=1 Tax=Roseomonas sp. E05 TaxID=3046310 RepID=UPI0024B998FF|nr:DUF4403 family protein [Roseomonas sp. E05]MDJ0388013.1 DUF4403 family protein [Roseomonas sp. E05]